MKAYKLFFVIFLWAASLFFFSGFGYFAAEGSLFGVYTYKEFETPRYCGTCHTDIYRQWEQSMMAQAYTHHWDEIEYFDLAVAHGKNDPAFKDAHEGCNGCHAPLAYMAGDVPPPKPAENSRANESVSCEVCHLIQDYEADTPFNFNFVVQPGKTKYSSREGEIKSPDHKIMLSELHSKAEFCGICHNEKNSFGIWVKSTHLEWMAGPYAREGVPCQDCHMPPAGGKTAKMGSFYEDARQHLFHGAHDPGKVKGTIELRIHPDIREAEPGDPVVFTLALFNQKTGHKFPTGSVEDRIVWLHVEAVDSKGNTYHLPVDKKGFEGEEYTIAGTELAYSDLSVPLGKPGFKGVDRDGVPAGDRIFRMPYFDENGIMTIMQWNTRSLGVDYRIGPRETKMETFTFQLPDGVAPGKLTVTAVLNYQKLVKPVADLLNVPEDESEIIEVNRHSTEIEIFE
ncbi:MAG: hypothetical protein JXA03_12000 [Bacteroidales bacterium]|nr:hypothetical protein [Bacteroidales bacterium]